MLSITRHLLVAAVCMLAPVALAQGQLSWVTTSYDMGTFGEDEGKQACKFAVVNEGDSAATLTRARTGCGCTVVDLPTAPIAPGDTAWVGVTYNPMGRPGKFSKDIWVYSTATPQRTQLTITGNVIATPETVDKQYPDAAGDAMRFTGHIIPFGETMSTGTRMASLQGYNASLDTMLVHVTCDAPHLVATIVPDTVAPGDVTSLIVHITGSKAPLWGFNSDSVTITATPLHPSAAAHSGSLDVEVSARVLEDFGKLSDDDIQKAPIAVVTPAAIDLGRVARDSVVTASFDVRNAGKRPLTIHRVWCPTPSVSATIARETLKHGQHSGIDVNINTSLLKDPFINLSIDIITTDPAQPVQQVRIVGQWQRK